MRLKRAEEGGVVFVSRFKRAFGDGLAPGDKLPHEKKALYPHVLHKRNVHVLLKRVLQRRARDKQRVGYLVGVAYAAQIFRNISDGFCADSVALICRGRSGRHAHRVEKRPRQRRTHQLRHVGVGERQTFFRKPGHDGGKVGVVVFFEKFRLFDRVGQKSTVAEKPGVETEYYSPVIFLSVVFEKMVSSGRNEHRVAAAHFVRHIFHDIFSVCIDEKQQFIPIVAVLFERVVFNVVHGDEIHAHAVADKVFQ